MTDRQATARETRAGIDIGGTFTDLLLHDPLSQTFVIGKTLTTSRMPAEGVREGLLQLAEDAGKPIEEIAQIVHGTTLVTNALIERRGANTALITTKGFRDALEIAREHRYDLYDLNLELPKPLVPRRLRFELNERILADGTELRPVDFEELRQLIATIVDLGCEAVAVCLLHSYVNPEHEREVAAALAELAPAITVSVSSDVVPEIREYERTSTTVANVYVRPLVSAYLDQLVIALEEIGYQGSLLVMLSSGGLSTVDTASRYPVRLVESGPAAGALAAAHFGKLTSRPALLSFDMGGTTAKCCLIGPEGPGHSSTFEVSRVYRFKKGSGLPVTVPVVELIEIGAGGGSIAKIDSLGLLKVGPESAGADPGPACYGLGGTRPTVTDADLLLGYLDPDFFLGGKLRLDLDAARRAIEPLASDLGMTVEEAAWGIHEVVNEQMAGAARIHAIEQGRDPREFPVFAFGGAGPVHAFRVAQILRAPEVIVPPFAGVASTIGFLVAPLAFDFVRTLVRRLDQMDWDALQARFDDMEREGRALLTAAGVREERLTITRLAEMRYVGQGHEVMVEIPSGQLGPSAAPEIEAAFEEVYQRLYGRTASGNAVETVNLRLTASAPVPSLPLAGVSNSDTSAPRDPRKGERLVYLPEAGGFAEVPVLDRYALQPGFSATGPAIVEERESTVVIGPNAAIAVDNLGSLVITMPPAVSSNPSAT